MNLGELQVGESGLITSVNGQKSLRGHLLDMGLTPRTVVKVNSKAPLGDPIEISLRGYRLTMRLEDANNIVVESINATCSGNCADCVSKLKQSKKRCD